MDNQWNSKSITCTNIPEEFLDKTVAKKHFGQFGPIKSFSLRPKNYSCVVEFENAEEAEIAKENGYVYNDYEFEIEFTEENKSPSLLEIDPDVQMELHAMKGGSIFGEPLPQSQNTFIKRPMQPKALVKNEINTDIEQLLRRQAHSVEDKYRILTERDKIIRQYQQSEKGKCLIGACPDMCPEKERVMREFQMQVANFEISPRTNQMDHKIAVKQYSRSSADQETPLPHELRPANVLRMSMNYLMSRIVDLSEDPKTNISDWFHFVWDRMRSIRKDITQQDLCTLEAVTLVEQCARFHIHCSARLVAEDPSVFDQKINTENLTKCLQTLKYMYRDLRLQNVACPNEPEFRAYVVLLNLNDGNFLWEFQQFPNDILKSKELKFALLVYQAIENNNYKRFFQLVQNTTYLNACILLRYFIQVRLKAVLILLKAYAPKNPSKFSLKEFSNVLAFEDFDSTCNFLECHGLTCDEDAVYLDRRNFYYPDFPFTQERSHGIVESKRNLTVGEIINGCSYAAKQMESLEKHQLQNSFDDYGYLKSDTFDHVLSTKTQNNQLESVFKVPTRTVSPRPKKSLENTTKFEMPLPSFPIVPPVIPVAPVMEKKIEPISIFSLPTPPKTNSGDGTLSSMSKGFNFLQAIETKVVEENPKLPETPVKPQQTVISFPTIDFNSPPKKIFMQVEKTPESLDRTDSLTNSTPSMKVFTPFTPLTPALSSVSSTSITPKETKIKEVDTELKLKGIQESATKLSTEVVNEVTSDLLQSIAEKELVRSKRLYETLPKELLTTLINEVLEENVMEIAESELLVEQILEARKLRHVYKAFKHWIFITRRNTYRKYQLVSAPFYVDNSPLSVVAEEFRLPNQRKSITLNQSFEAIPKPVMNKIDTLEIVSREFKSNNVSYWKGIISFPDDKEDRSGKFPIMIENWLKNSFSLDDNATFTVKKYVKRLKHDLAITLQTVKGLNGNVKSANGVIFIINHPNIRLCNDRWRHLVSKLANNEVPVAIIVCYSNEKDTNEIVSLLNLNKNGPTNFKIINHASKSLKTCVEEGLQYIASHSKQNSISLEMEQTGTCLSKAIGEEFWCRLTTSIYDNEALLVACQKESKYLVDVVNSALDQLISLLGKPFSDVITFPEELKELLVTNKTDNQYPMSLERFPIDWSSTRNVDKLKTFLKSLRLPHFPQKPSTELEVLKTQIANYVKTVVGNDVKNVSRLVHLAQMQVFEDDDEETEDINVSWIDIIHLLAVQNFQEGMKRLAAIPFVVYDRSEMQQFLTEAWWLTMDMENVRERSQSFLESTFNKTQTSKKRKSYDDISLSSDEVSKILKTGEATLKKLESRNFNNSYVPDRSGVASVFREAESYFKENHLKWKQYEEKLFGGS